VHVEFFARAGAPGDALAGIAGGGFVLGIGAGSVSSGVARVLTERGVPRGERKAGFEEFVELTALPDVRRPPATSCDVVRAGGPQRCAE
jgi:hypothetical protein